MSLSGSAPYFGASLLTSARSSAPQQAEEKAKKRQSAGSNKHDQSAAPDLAPFAFVGHNFILLILQEIEATSGSQSPSKGESD